MIHKVQSKVETTLLTAYPTFGVEVKLVLPGPDCDAKNVIHFGPVGRPADKRM